MSIELQGHAPAAPGLDLGFRLASMINGQPAAMRDRELQALVHSIAANRFTVPRKGERGHRITDKGTAIVEIHGALFNRAPILGSFYGISFYEGLGEQFRRLKTNKEVGHVVLDLDTPGGLVSGIKQCVEALADLAKAKPVYAIAHDMACSAGYWLGCIAKELSVTPDGEVGSIGVRSAHVSYAEALERDGVAVNFFKAGTTKTDFNAYEMLDAGAAGEEQYGIERAYDIFCEHVAKYRPMTANEARATAARTFVGEKAVEAKLADRVETIEQLIERIERKSTKNKKSSTPARRNAPERERRTPAAGNSPKTGASNMSQQRMEDSAADSRDLAAEIATELSRMNLTTARPATPAPAEQPAAAAKDEVTAALDRVFGIIESDEAKDRIGMAIKLAKSGIAVEAAKEILQAAPVEKPAAKKEGDEDAAALASALDKRMDEAGNSARVAPEADGKGARKSLADKMKERRKAA